MQERRAQEDAPAKRAPVAPPEPKPVTPSDRCESCGGPKSLDADLCETCQQAFHAFLDDGSGPPKGGHYVESAGPAKGHDVGPVDSSVASAVAVQDVADTSSPADSGVADAASTSPALHEPTPQAVLNEPTPHVTEARSEPVESTRVEMARLEAAQAEWAKSQAEAAAQTEWVKFQAEAAAQAEARRREAEAAMIDAQKSNATRPEAPKPQTAKPVQNVAPPAAAKTAKPAKGSPSQPKSDSLARAAVVVVIVAATGLGLGAYWIKVKGMPGQAAAVPVTTVVDTRPAPPDPIAVAEAAIKDYEAKSAQAPAAPTPTVTVTPMPVAAPKTKSSAVPKVPAKVARQLATPTRQVASALAPSAAPEAPVHAAAPEPVAAVAPAPEPVVTAPLRPYFETRDVNESPQVATRVEPQLPGDLRDYQKNDVVVVRLLVSQTGHPSQVSLLRRSKAGDSLDNAVVEAVKQWRFSPAKKRGEAVSCWLNVGVPIGRAN